MIIIVQVLWTAMLLLFFAGAVTYAVSSHAGVKLLKRSLVLAAVLLIGPSLLSSAFAEIPTVVKVFLGVGLTLAAYFYLTQHSDKDTKHHGGSNVSHAERQPRLPHQPEDDEE